MHPLRLDDEAIFHVARKIEAPEARAAYLAQVCGEDDGLRREVEVMLSAYDRERSFLESPAIEIDRGGTAAWSPPIEGPGTVIGPYKLLERIGEGGMGTVYMAEQTEPVRRRVALKVIKPGMDSKQVVARFEAERQALAMMDHPNIARVFDAGMTASGRPYFVMELVRGLPITEYCDREELTISERLELFVLVCRAVQHAHQKGVIHRDLKPSNVLVTVIDGAAVPKVIDFGVAKATGQALTDKTLFTGFHQFVGTPLYVSPEQAGLAGVDVDTRSDIYSLGVLLYELLTGTTPFDRETLRRAAFDEMRRMIREEEPPRPSTRLSSLGERLSTVSARRKADPRRLGSSLKGELDWLVMKALEKDRNRRYETANDLAADVMRHLTGQAVEAHPPSVHYRFTKFVRRNRSVVIPTAVLTLMAVAGLTIGMAAVTRERDEARAQRQQANARFRLAYQVVDRLRDAYTSLRSDAGPEATARLQRAVRDDLVRYYSQLIEAIEDDSEISYELGDSYYFLGSLHGPDDRERRDRAFFQALSAYERAAKDRPNDTQVLGSLAIHYVRIARRYLGNEPERRGATFSRALDLYERIARTHPDRIDDWVMIYLVANRYGGWLRGQGRSAEAERLDRRVLALFERPEIDLDWFVKAKVQSPFGLIFLSELLVRRGQPLRAIPILQRARPHLLFAEQNSQYSQAVTNLCLALASDSDPAVVARAVALAREEVEFTSRSDAQRWLLLGFALERTGDRQGADDAVRRGIELSGDNAAALNRFAWKLVTDPRVSGRLPLWLVNLARRATEKAPKSAGYWNTLGVALYRAGDWENAIATMEKSETLEPGKHVVWNGFFLAMAHWRRGEKEQARQWYEKAVAGMKPDDDEVRQFRDEAAALLGATPPGEDGQPRHPSRAPGPPP